MAESCGEEEIEEMESSDAEYEEWTEMESSEDEEFIDRRRRT
jgi:hypothetical protein